MGKRMAYPAEVGDNVVIQRRVPLRRAEIEKLDRDALIDEVDVLQKELGMVWVYLRDMQRPAYERKRK